MQNSKKPDQERHQQTIMALGALQNNNIKHQNGQRTITATAHAKKPDQEGHQ